jgi:hypothetical protein
MRSDTKPKSGRVNPFVKRSVVSARGTAVKPLPAGLQCRNHRRSWQVAK